MLKRLLDWFASHALWDAAKLLWASGGAAVTGLAQWLTGHPSIHSLLLSVAIVLIFAAGAVIVSRKRGTLLPGHVTSVETAVLSQLWAGWAAIGDMYERLDYDNRDNTSTRLPFHEASWGDFDTSWSFVKARLYSMNELVRYYAKDTEGIIQALGWNDSLSVPRIEQSTVMVDFIRDVREFSTQLDRKREELQRAWPRWRLSTARVVLPTPKRDP